MSHLTGTWGGRGPQGRAAKVEEALSPVTSPQVKPMSTSPKPARYGQTKPRKERRAPRGAPGSTRWLKSLLARPIALERRGAQLHVTLVERRRTPEVIDQQERAQLCDEVRVLLLTRGTDHEVAVLRHLVLVLDVLGTRGWDGVGAMASGVLRKALMQAQLLDAQESAPALSYLIERLRLLQVAAGLREERKRQGGSPIGPDRAEVSEATHEEFEAMQRRWENTVSPTLEPSEKPI